MNTLITTEDGSHSLQSSRFDVTYHSVHGAIQETQTVFIDAALNYKAAQQQELSILGIGFGTGLNAFMTYLEAVKQGLSIHYIGVEAYPIDMETAKQLNHPALLQVPHLEQDFLALHQSQDTTIQIAPEFTFCKHINRFEALDYNNQFDIIYYDAFAPNAQPELWEADILSKMYQALKPTGVLTTYCAKGVFKRCLKSVGFTIEALPGPIGKREMTRAVK